VYIRCYNDNQSEMHGRVMGAHSSFTGPQLRDALGSGVRRHPAESRLVGQEQALAYASINDAE
jgi:hypothetical protein